MDHQPTIVIIEDNLTTAKKLKLALENEHYRVIHAKDATSGIEKVKQYSPDLIIQDLILPDMDGTVLNQQLRQLPQGSKIPIIALSGFLNKLDNISLSGFTACLIKPIEISHLIKVISSYLPEPSLPVSLRKVTQHILLVDDNLIQLELLKLQLSQEGYCVTTASGGEEALQQMITHTPDAIVCDVLMPYMDGFEFCLKIRRNLKLAHLPVILLTSHYLETEDRRLGEKVAATAYLVREPSAGNIISVLKKCFKEKLIEKKPKKIDSFEKDHTHRLICQLEHQVIANTSLAQRCALQAAQLSLLSEIASSLANAENINRAIQSVLSICLDSAGVSKGALYLKKDNDQVYLSKIIGFNQEDEEILQNLFLEIPLLNKAMGSQQVEKISSDDSQKIAEFFKKISLTTILLAPLSSRDKCLGVLMLGFQAGSPIANDSVLFARALGIQLGQALELATALNHIVVSEERYRIFMDNASCGIFISDTQGKIEEVNKQVEKLLHCDKNQMVHRDYRDFVHEPDRIYATEQLNKLLQEGEVGPSEIRFRSCQGDIKTIEFSGVTINTSGEKLLLIIITDITERTQLRAFAQLNDRLASMGMMAAGVAHEINNPIAWVLSNLNFIENYIKSLDETINKIPEVNIEDIAIINKMEELIFNPQRKIVFKIKQIIRESIEGAEKIHEIVASLKGFSRINDSDVSVVDIHKILEDAINIAVPEFKGRARLEKDFCTNLPVIMSNSGKLHQVFLNLIINAAQSIPEGDAKNNKIKIVTQYENDHIVVQIIDTGAGIPEENLVKIFEPFFTTKPVGQGTGLGLSICHKILKDLGGSINVKSRLGEGSVFTVRLPHNNFSPKISQSDLNILKTENKKILLIDDEPYLLNSLRRMLEPYYQVAVALGGEEALDLIAKKNARYDVIVSDLAMPDVSGVDLYNYIKKNHPGLVNHIIFMTGGVYTRVLQDFVSHIGNICLEKPFDEKELIAAIEKITREES